MKKDKYIKIQWQKGVIPKNGINGVQVVDVLDVVKEHLNTLDKNHPSEYNKRTIDSINNAIKYQNMRTKNRIERSVEGKYEN